MTKSRDKDQGGILQNADRRTGMSPEEKAGEFHQKGGSDRKVPSGDAEANRRNQPTHEGPIE